MTSRKRSQPDRATSQTSCPPTTGPQAPEPQQSSDSNAPRMHRRRFLEGSAGLTLAAAAVSARAAAAAPQTADTPKKPASGSAGGGSLEERLGLSAAGNAVIEQKRRVALDILKPSARDLEHGLKLHAESVVFDSYGFAPRAAIDGEAMKAAVEAHASVRELKDMSEDMSMTRYVTDPRERAEFDQAFRASGVTCIFQNAGEEGQAPTRLLKRLARFTYATDLLGDSLRKAVVPDDIVAAKRDGARCLYLTGNGVPLTERWDTVEEELAFVRIFFQLGIRMMHLTYQRRNMIGDGCGETSDAGLSDFGRRVVAELNRQGVIADVAHSGWQTSLEAAQASEKPMVASHTTCAALHKHIRSKPDRVIREIVETGGYVGICCIPRYLGGPGDISALLDHVDYVVKKFGPEHVAIGTDVAYTSRNAGEERKKVPPRARKRPDWRSLWPADDYRTTPSATASLAWTNWPLFTVGLVQRGHSDEVIRQILGGNVLRVARAALEP